MQRHDFRNEAWAAVRRARELLANAAELASLRYAALEVRFAMEALTYDRAQSYRQDLPRSEIATWQPRKLLGVLLELNPRADADVSVSVGRQPARGVPASPDVMRSLGAETVLNLRVLKAHYDALGSYLHMPTIKQLDEGGAHNRDRLHSRLSQALEYLEKVLASPIFNVTMMGLNSQIDCVRCGHRIRKAVEGGAEELKARCPECAAPYTMVARGDDQFDWCADKARIPCADRSCEGEMFVFEDEVKVGLVLDCPICHRSTRVVLGVNLLPDEGEGAA